jgi:hypothetical protein
MANLQYSSAAINVRNRFYNAEKMVYVEGDDDVPFWEFMFDKMTNINVKVQSVGGKLELEKYANNIFSGELESIVAMDSDFSLFDSLDQHPNILVTCGYSIENTMISAATLWQVICSIGKLSRNDFTIEECGKWLSDLNDKSESLVTHDIQNHILKTGHCLSLDNCTRYMKGKRKPILCSHKIEKHIIELGIEIDGSCSQRIEEQFKKHPSGVMGLLRGHFLFSAALTYVSHKIVGIRGKSNISNEAMFGSTLMSFQNTFSKEHSHYSHYETVFNRLGIT